MFIYLRHITINCIGYVIVAHSLYSIKKCLLALDSIPNLLLASICQKLFFTLYYNIRKPTNNKWSTCAYSCLWSTLMFRMFILLHGTKFHHVSIACSLVPPRQWKWKANTCIQIWNMKHAPCHQFPQKNIITKLRSQFIYIYKYIST